MEHTFEGKKEAILAVALEHPLCEYCFGTTDKIPFSERVRHICRTDCERYGRSWSCPPHCGTVEDNTKKCLEYDNFFLFSTVTPVEDAWNKDECLAVKKEHEAVSRAVNEALKGKLEDHLILSTGCSLCEQCTCPDEPCRFPERRISSLESHGIVIISLTEEMGLTHTFGPDSVVYFGMVLF